jgi:osmotically-inducible protein OsmY
MAIGEPLPMSTLSGASARTVEGEEIGVVYDVVLDDSSDRIRFAVIERGIDGKLLVVPWALVTFRPGERVVHLNVTAKKLNAAPALNQTESLRVESPEWQRQICAFYGSRPYWEEHWDEEVPPMVRIDRHRNRGAQVVRSLLLLVLVTGLGYLAFRQGWTATAEQVTSVAATVRDTTQVFRNSSADAATTAKVKTALTLAKNVAAFDINVDTHDGVTTLTGKVASPENRELVGQIAADTAGVGELRNQLIVDPTVRPELGRQYLAHRVEELERQNGITQALQDSPEMDGAKVKVRVTGGDVLLEGTVNSDAQKVRAYMVARSVNGVRSVDNRLQIIQSES